MIVLGVCAVGVLALVGVDAPELLLECWWRGEFGSGKLQLLVLTLTLRKQFSVEKDFDWSLPLRCWGFWDLGSKSALSGTSHWGRVLLRELLVLRGSELLSALKLMSS